ncbi:copper chaperone PCu(A)C [Lysobacter capsici]|uniref:copper chaperone PCu(A)C n=1 Tax=Lysobacter capsici TaxID=435897 RepID=UPI00287BC991|nr:copper chaperone PCu(A)C [Lysobacter capsici]WND82392.1 copper chaperone PCu(A)C [Lysobacter capsici]WND87588.1 copper chaperone PCu(A)C [Lysobacter capsici]
MNVSAIRMGLTLAGALGAACAFHASAKDRPAPPAATATGACIAKGQITVRDAWVRLPPMQMPMMAGFGRIENRCAAPVVIVAAKSAAFADVSLHETRIVDGVSKMRALPELRIAPDGAAVLKPGGMHLMLMQPHAPLKQGSRVAIEFELKGGGSLLGEFEVRKAAP